MKPDLRRLLVPVDFSAGSDRATEYAAVLGAALGASIHLLHVVEEPFVTQGAWEFVEPDTPQRRERIIAERKARLDAVAAGFRGSCGRVTTEIAGGHAPNRIIVVATDRGSDLIVMGTHGRTGWSHLVHGSVAEYVIRHAPCPVLAICERGVGYAPSREAVQPDRETITCAAPASDVCTTCERVPAARSTT